MDIAQFFEGYYSSILSRLVYEGLDTRSKTQEEFQKEICSIQQIQLNLETEWLIRYRLSRGL